MPGQPPTKADVSRIQSTQAKNHNDTGKSSFPARLQSAQAKHENAGCQGGANQGGANQGK
ncbi:hypothetical protein BDF21DRAFT_420586 [Thamnidium elegans]|nr:hypothetical protein BDF21DRAFT_420586 [Thamnidium elegans]